MPARYQGYHYHYLGYHFTRCSLVLRKPSLIHFYVVWCGYSSVSFESFVLNHLVIVPVRNTKKLPLSACPSTPQGNQCEMLHFVPSMGPCNPVFQCTQVQPLPSPHKQCWTRVSRIFLQVSTLDRVRGGTTARKCRKGCTVLRGNREMTEKYEYCSTVPRTFVQDCSSFLPFIFLFRLSSSSLIAVISSSRSRRN